MGTGRRVGSGGSTGGIASLKEYRVREVGGGKRWEALLLLCTLGRGLIVVAVSTGNITIFPDIQNHINISMDRCSPVI